MARRLTVAQILPELHAGGVERGTLEVNAALVARGHRSLVVSGGGRLVEQLVRKGGEHFTIPVGRKSPATIRCAWPLRSLLVDQKVDILHAGRRAGPHAWRGSTHKRPRLVTTCHGLYSVNAFSRVMTTGARVIAISRLVQRYIEANYPGVDPACIRLIHRGVSADEFPFGHEPSAEWWSAWHAAFPQTQGRPMLVLPGRLSRLKGHRYFIELLDRLRDVTPQAIGVVVGGEDPKRPGYAAEIRELVARRRLTNIVFAGPRSDMRDVLAAAALVLSLTTDPPEAFGRTTLEALSVGTPVVGFDRSGVEEILVELFPAGSVPQGNVDDLTGRVAALLNSPQPVRPNTVFTLQSMLDQTLAVYDEVMQLGAARRMAA